MNPNVLQACDAERLLGKSIDHEYSLAELLRRPGIGFDEIDAIHSIVRPGTTPTRTQLNAELGPVLADAVIKQVQVAIKYSGYIDKQRDEVRRAASLEELPLPVDFDYHRVRALSFEVRQKLTAQRPRTLGLASRISGVTPAAISLLLVHLKKHRLGDPAADVPALHDASV